MHFFRRLNIKSQIAVLIAIITVFMLVSFGIIDFMTGRAVKRTTLESNEKLLQQVEGRVAAFTDDMENISLSLFYSPTIINYIGLSQEVDRVLAYEDVSAVCSNAMSLKKGIKGVMIYDGKGELCAGVGTNRTIPAGIESVSQVVYTGCLGKDKKYYAIVYPIYDLKSTETKKRLGSGVLLMDCGQLGDILENSLVTQGSAISILDKNDRCMAFRGAKHDEKGLHGGKDAEYVTRRTQLSKAGWTLVSDVPGTELQAGRQTIRKYCTAAFAAIAVILAFFVFTLWTGILRPVKKATEFAKRYPLGEKDKRLEMDYKNEIGDMARSLNQMLDDIQRLSSDVQSSQKKMYEMVLDQKQMEIISYRNQVNPHFLYNTFDCIRGMAAYYNVPQIAEITSALSRFYRYTVKGDDCVTIADEVLNIQEYAKIIEHRFMGRISVNVDASKEILSCTTIKLLLQPLVENSVFHGLEQKVEGGRVEVFLTPRGAGKIHIKVRDNGVGIEKDRLEEILQHLEQREKIFPGEPDSGYGIGLANVYHRIRLFYGEHAEFDITSKKDKGTTVTVCIPNSAAGGIDVSGIIN